MLALKKNLFRHEPPQRIKENMIERTIYNLCVSDEMTNKSVNIPAFQRARNGIEIIKHTGMVDFYFNNRKKIVQFCRRSRI